MNGGRRRPTAAARRRSEAKGRILENLAHEKLSGETQDSQVVEKDALVKLSERSKGPWIEDYEELKPCWSTVFDQNEIERSRGYVTFSLTNGPEYHVSQVADAVVVARYLSATLVLPDIRGNNGAERAFKDIYNVEKFMKSLEGVVRVANGLPDQISIRDLAAVKVPNRVTEDYIVENVVPVFKSKGNVRLATYFPTANMRKTAQKTSVDSVACLGMFGTLELQPEVNEVIDSMVKRLRTLSRKSNGRFIAVDLRVEVLENKNCHGSSSVGAKSCYSAEEIALFLRKVGFDMDTTIYLTQTTWDSSLSVLKDIFPRTYTKVSKIFSSPITILYSEPHFYSSEPLQAIVMPKEKSKFLEPEGTEFERVIDFYICSQSDIFVPAISGLFYANVTGKRIASGKPQILVLAEISGSSAEITTSLLALPRRTTWFIHVFVNLAFLR
ncbi:hypothetical protein F3Y22_tig00111095pilonHSYRG00380 [Hibiscus syriacus]|uniref:O-fucosyltransferase family protein n=1 Tax=Hibiscus syriacus TaxID=106335 RepID=A0A6A2Z160_HIBSY|nr:hypothetical protein F3Y22_tig00111095pilonHSYRG00380 [Hibiscus syriacus]